MRRSSLLIALGLGATSLTAAPAHATDTVGVSPLGYAQCEAWLDYSRDAHGGRAGSAQIASPTCANITREAEVYGYAADLDPNLTVDVRATSYDLLTGGFFGGTRNGTQGARVRADSIDATALYMLAPRIPLGTGAYAGAMRSQVTYDCFGDHFLGTSQFSAIGTGGTAQVALLPDGVTLVETNKTSRHPVVDANGLSGEEIVQQALVYTNLVTGAQRVIGEAKLTYFGNPCAAWG